MQNVVDDKMAKMEAAAEADMEDHGNKRPAIQKLKILAEVEDFLSQVWRNWFGRMLWCVEKLVQGVEKLVQGVEKLVQGVEKQVQGVEKQVQGK